MYDALAFEVLGLKPHCSLTSMSFMHNCANSLLQISFSKTLAKEVKTDMGMLLEVISLSPFLNIGLIIQNFILLETLLRNETYHKHMFKGKR